MPTLSYVLLCVFSDIFTYNFFFFFLKIIKELKLIVVYEQNTNHA